MELSRQYFREKGYQTARKLSDGTWIGLDDSISRSYMSIYTGINWFGWAERYDYKHEDVAIMFMAYFNLKTYDDIPIGGILKRPI